MSQMRAKSVLFEQMQKRSVPLGIFISSLDPAVTDVLAGAGFDFVVLDGEHGRFGRTDVETHVRAASCKGALPFVRVLENSPTLIQSTLDVGAQGILVPHIDSAADARRAIAAAHYAPAGKRGMCPACHAGNYDLAGWHEHVRLSNENVLIIPIIESRAAVDNIEEIAAVPGIDIIHFGPGDLSADMGLNFSTQRDQLDAAWKRVQQVTWAAGKKLLSPRGYGFDEADMLLVEMELMLLHRAARTIVSDHRRQ